MIAQYCLQNFDKTLVSKIGLEGIEFQPDRSMTQQYKA
jgi:hypothetical protein